MSDQSIVRLRGVAKDYRRGAETVNVLHALDLDIPKAIFSRSWARPDRANRHCSI